MDSKAIKAGPPPAPTGIKAGLPDGAATAIQESAPVVLTRTTPTPVGASMAAPASVPWLILQFLASLRITVVLFVLAFILVFFGTWAMVDMGNWSAVKIYFRSAIVFIPLKVISLRTLDIPGAIPYPGGWLIGGCLLINLLAAHAIRFKISWKRSGILLIHSGIILMMLGELITGLFAIEGRMTIPEGQASNYLDHDHNNELAVVRHLNAETDEEVIVPDRLLQRKQPIQHELLPFDLEVVQYMVNSAIRKYRAESDGANAATAGIGLERIALERPEVSGVDPDQQIDIASAYITLKKKGTGEPLGTYLVSTWFTFLIRPADQVVVDGQKYQISLRAKRSYRSYTIRLDKFHHDVYPGTDKPRNYQSDIRLIDPPNQEDRDVQISMNDPLRYRGETFYQSGLHPLAYGTVLQVVRNPGWLLPYISCVVVTLGLLIHFGIHLVGFIRRNLA